jgi:hypothetical protein
MAAVMQALLKKYPQVDPAEIDQQAIALATERIRAGGADVILAGGGNP